MSPKHKFILNESYERKYVNILFWCVPDQTFVCLYLIVQYITDLYTGCVCNQTLAALFACGLLKASY